MGLKLGDGESSENSDDEKTGVRRAWQARQAGEVWRAHGGIDRPQAVVQFPRTVSTVRLSYHFFLRMTDEHRFVLQASAGSGSACALRVERDETQVRHIGRVVPAW